MQSSPSPPFPVVDEDSPLVCVHRAVWIRVNTTMTSEKPSPFTSPAVPTDSPMKPVRDGAVEPSVIQVGVDGGDQPAILVAERLTHVQVDCCRCHRGKPRR